MIIGINMKTFKEFINEGIKDYLKPKSEEEIMREIEKMDDLKRIHHIRSFNLSQKFLPPDDRIQKVLDKMPFMRKMFFIKRNKLPDRFLPSHKEIDEELNKMSSENRKQAIDNLNLDGFRPKRWIKDRLNNINKIKNFIDYNGALGNFNTTWILTQIIQDDRYEEIILQSLTKDGVKYIGYDNGIDYPDNFIRYEDLTYFAVKFIWQKIIKKYKEYRNTI